MYTFVSRFIDGIRRLGRDRRGVSSIVVAVSSTAILSMFGIVIDLGVSVAAKNALQANTNSAALAAAQNWSASGGTAESAKTAATAWHIANPPPLVTITNSSATAVCVSTTTGLPNCTSSSPNVIKVTQSGSISFGFMSLFGVSAFNVSATAAASQAGGYNKPFHVMFVIDSTGSMNNADVSGCTVPGYSNPTRFQCAEYGVQIVLKQLLASQDAVGIMAFPGWSKAYVPSNPCPSFPSPVAYSSSTVYQVGTTAFDSTYNNSSRVLSDISPAVYAVGDFSNSKTGCLQSKGGEGTYYADAISKAQASLNANGSTGYQNVIIFLSDGGASASSSQTTFSTSKECTAGVTAAAAAATAGTWVYSVAYDAATTSSSSGCNGDITPCAAMQTIASDPTKFFSTSSACTLSTSPNTYTDLTHVFTQISYSLLQPRLVIAP